MRRPLAHILTLILLAFNIPAYAQVQEDTVGCYDNDFWVTYFVNGYSISDGTCNTVPLSVDVAGPEDAVVTVSNPVTGIIDTYNHTRGTKTHILLATVSDIPSGTPSDKGWHITSSAPITVVATNYKYDSYDNCMLLPTAALGNEYIVQDNTLQSSVYAPVIALVATEGNTNIRMLFPCPVAGISTAQTDTFRITLNTGQSLMLRSTTWTGFSGMEVLADKPIALFQGHSCGRVNSSDNGGRDLQMEQARPLSMWGTEFIVIKSMNRNEPDQVLVTAGADNCQVGLDNTLMTTLQRGQTYNFNITSQNHHRITTTQPAYVCLYGASYERNTQGDPFSSSINPVYRWVNRAYYALQKNNTNPNQQNYIQDNNNYINIVTRTSTTDSMMLDEQCVTGFVPVGQTGYSYARVVTEPGAHTLRNSQGTFTANAYGFGAWVGYGFDVGLRVDPVQYDTIDFYDTICLGQGYDTLNLILQPIHNTTVGTFIFHRNVIDGSSHFHYIIHLTVLPTPSSETYVTIAYGDTIIFDGTTITEEGDYILSYSLPESCDSIVTIHISYRYDTIDIYDTICRGQSYTGNGFDLPIMSTVGTRTFLRDTIEGTIPHRYMLHLTVLPDYNTIIERTIVAGDTIHYEDTILSAIGSYTFHYTANNGCDSTVTLQLTYETVSIYADKDGVCPGDPVVITATGTHTYIWTSSPYDPELDSLQGQNPITVHPEENTTYCLVDEQGTTLACLTVGTAPPPVPCVESNREILDFDNPTLNLLDCSSDRYNTTWTFDDGLTLTGTRARRTWNRAIFVDLPDSVHVTMTTCNRYNCCVDTSLSFPMRIRSIYFPNIFTPDEESNNLFGCHTSFDVEEFELTIFNRWGLQLWSTTDINQGWDGRRADGSPCPQGAYVYHYYLRATDGTVDSKIGTITLLR